MTIFWTSFFPRKKGAKEKQHPTPHKIILFQKNSLRKKNTQKMKKLESNKATKMQKQIWFRCVSFLFFFWERKKNTKKKTAISTINIPSAIIIKGAGGPHSSFAASDKAFAAVSLVLRNCHRFTPLKFNTKEPEKKSWTPGNPEIPKLGKARYDFRWIMWTIFGGVYKKSTVLLMVQNTVVKKPVEVGR